MNRNFNNMTNPNWQNDQKEGIDEQKLEKTVSTVLKVLLIGTVVVLVGLKVADWWLTRG